MIDTALAILQTELSNHFGGGVDVVLDNVALLDSANASAQLTDKVIISLVNVEEESTLKNGVYYRRNAIGGIDYENSPVFLNLYVVISANFQSNYSASLNRLAGIIQCFQGKNSFTFPDLDGNEAQMTLDLYTMTFEQINHLWGSLGGKQIPFALYKTRLLRITDNRRLATGSVIIEIEGDVSPVK